MINKKIIIRGKLLASSLIFSGLVMNAQVRLPSIISDHMVIQQNMPVRVWGWADPGEKVTITLNEQKAAVSTGKDGKWRLTLPAMKAGGPYILTVKGKNLITLNDVMVGEVWLCSGQSNMEFNLKRSLFAKEEIPESSNKKLRHFKVPNRLSADPQEDMEGGSWQVSSPETSGDFSAVAYYFGKKISTDLNVTVGLINASWGGTFIEAWMSYNGLHALPDFSSYHDLTPVELENWFGSTEKKYDQLFSSLGITDRNSIKEDSAAWCRSDFDDSKWLIVSLPQRFDYDLLPRFDGVVWFRREINIPEDVARNGITLHLGRIDDFDVTYINGKKVGSTMGVGIKRDYLLKPEMLKQGKNIIAIRVLDYWERGGFLDPASEFKASSGKWEQSLSGDWRMTIGKLSFMWIRTPSAHPNLLFNGLLSPILQYAFKGAIWYQGENNVLFAEQYRLAFPAMIEDWRKNFVSGEFPFYWVQLPNLNNFNQNSQHGGSDWAEMRESQAVALKLPETGMAVTIDLGDSTDIHPKDKIEVARRLALMALKNTYNQDIGEVESPTVSETKFQDNKAIIIFRNVGTGLVARDRYGYLKGFEVAGVDQKFYYVKAVIVGKSVIVSSEKVPSPVAIRYAWSNNPSDANLYNIEGFPAAPFRTDSWELSTSGSKYQNWIK
jgi:sialate O-acetylesterase